MVLGPKSPISVFRTSKILKFLKDLDFSIFHSPIRFQQALNQYHTIIFCRDIAKNVFLLVLGPKSSISVLGPRPPKFCFFKKIYISLHSTHQYASNESSTNIISLFLVEILPHVLKNAVWTHCVG